MGAYYLRSPDYSIMDAVASFFFPMLVAGTATVIIYLLGNWVDRYLERKNKNGSGSNNL